ncbi:MAG: LysR family transcriptional regulator [Spirochaetales bacterium]|nr:LysR family transcriptional regulator [Spirochaetales bacterium]
MEWKQIEYFLAISQHGSFSGAARALRLTQPALSRQIQLLEKELHCQLFDRQPRRIKLTTAGELLYGQARQLHDIWQATRRMMLDSTDELIGDHAISAGGVVATRVLPAALRKVRERYPRASFRIIEGDAREVLGALKNGSVQLGIVAGPLRREGSLASTYFFTDRIVPVMGRNHSLSRRRPEAARVFFDQDFVMLHPDSAIRQAVEKTLQGRRLNVVMELRSMQAVVESVSAGAGFGFVSELSLTKDLIRLPVQEVWIQRDIFFVHRHPGPDVRRLSAEILQASLPIIRKFRRSTEEAISS